MNRRFLSMLGVAISSLLITGFAQQSAPQPGGANFVGDDTCITCH